MLASVATFAIEGVDSKEVTVEVDVRRGLPVVHPRRAPGRGRARGARARARGDAELGARVPAAADHREPRARAHPQGRRQLRPRARGRAALCASGQVPREWFGTCAVWGELSLSGALRPMHGAVAVATGARRAGYERLIVPAENAAEAALVDGLEVLGVPSLDRLVDLVHERWRPEPPAPSRELRPAASRGPDLADVRGQHDARRALEIAAAGGHNLLMVGPPGRRQDDARAAAAGHPAAADLRGGRRDHAHPQRRRAERRPARDRAAVPRAAPHDLAVRPDRRRLDAAAGGDHARAPGRAVPRRARRVLAPGARGAAPAARGRARRDHARPALDRLSRRDHACRRLQRLSVRAAEGLVRLRRLRPRPLPASAERAAARPDRPRLPARAGAATRTRVPEPTSPEGRTSVRARVAAARERQRRRLAGSSALCNGSMDARLTRRHVPLDARLRARMLDGHRAPG